MYVLSERLFYTTFPFVTFILKEDFIDIGIGQEFSFSHKVNIVEIVEESIIIPAIDFRINGQDFRQKQEMANRFVLNRAR